VTVTVDLGPAIPTAGLTWDDRDGLISAVRTSISARLPRPL
jgi:hypothetical protein